MVQRPPRPTRTDTLFPYTTLFRSEMVRSAYTMRGNDDDFTQPGILVREVFDDTQRAGLVDQVAGSLLGGVREPVLSRAFEYWKNVDADVGSRIEEKVRAGAAPQPADGMGEG